ncbi:MULTISPECIES: hypothetical protein [Cupriavidus]
MSLSKYCRTLAALAVLVAQPALACSFNIAFNTAFEDRASRLPASEVRRLAEWMVDEPARYENKASFHIILYAFPEGGISRSLARERVSHLAQLLKTFGVPARLISTEIAAYRPRKLVDVPNFAQIDFMPGCPHPCCPGPQPIEQTR